MSSRSNYFVFELAITIKYTIRLSPPLQAIGYRTLRLVTNALNSNVSSASSSSSKPPLAKDGDISHFCPFYDAKLERAHPY